MDTLIIGHGVVGSNLERELKKLDPDVCDKYKQGPEHNRYREGAHYDIAFVCVDTPLTGTEDCDTSEVANAIREHDADLYVIKSTVYPGFTKAIADKMNKSVVFSPEYYGGTQHCNNFDFNFTIIGGEKEAAKQLIQCLQKVYDARHTFHITDSTTAELAKYMENSYLATYVSFCHQFFFIAEKFGSSYEELRELFVLDPRVNPSHTFVYRDHPYWQSHCLDKDVPTIANAADAPLLKAVIAFNEECKQVANADA